VAQVLRLPRAAFSGTVASSMRRTWSIALLVAAVAACGDRDVGLDQPDPLHEEGIALPPPDPGLPERIPHKAETQTFPVPAPPFSEGIFPCSRCHVGGPPAADTRPFTPHQTHLERDLACVDCHDPEETGTPTVPGEKTCFECHEDLSTEPAAVRKYFARIRQEDGTYVFPRRWKTRDTIANHPKHAAAGVTCDRCHGKASNGPFVKPRSVPLMARCVTCHEDRKVSTECRTCHREIRKRQHENIVLKHVQDQRGCMTCHNPADRDTLRLANGDSLPFAESYRLCGQCHGTKLRDWKLGLHGKRTGRWDGKKSYLLCVHCHQDPHQPDPPPMRPEPPPMRPEDIK
jgi:hypothetical protein